MTRETIKTEVGAMAHERMLGAAAKQDQQQVQQAPQTGQANQTSHEESENSSTSALSTIAIMRRHPMYDSLVLVKRFRHAQNGYALEFPTSDPSIISSAACTHLANAKRAGDCCKTKLVSLYLDGDDPIYQSQELIHTKSGFLSPEGEIVHVPMNGLLDRLDNYERHGIAIDGRVYAFAMGIKTAEKILRTSSMKEIQETPPM